MKSRFLRLLPGVVVLGAGLLVLNTTGLVHEAYAAGAPAPVTGDPVPMNQDYAQADDQAASAAQVDVMGSFAKRRVELDARESQLNMQANILAATEARIDAKIAQLKSLQDGIGKLLAQRDDEQNKQVAALIKTYGPDGMKPASAAAIFNTLPDEIVIPVAQGMKPGDLGPILSKMNPDAAQKLTVKLASRLALPVDAAAALPAAVAPVAAPTPTAAATDAKTPTPPKS